MANTAGTPLRPGEEPDSLGFLIAAMVFAGLAVIIVALIPAVCAAVIFFALRPWLARRDWFLMALAGVAGFAWYLRDNAIGYGYWLLSFIHVGKVHPGQVPITVLLCLGAALAGVTG